MLVRVLVVFGRGMHVGGRSPSPSQAGGGPRELSSTFLRPVERGAMRPPTNARRRGPRPKRVDCTPPILKPVRPARPARPINVVVRPNGMQPMPRIRIEVQGQTFEADLGGEVVRVGKNPGLDLQLTCDGVGAEHCTIDPLPNGRYRLKDGNSGYDTLVNGIAVRQVSSLYGCPC